MKIRIYRFMSWLGLILIGVSSLIPEKHLAYGYYKTFVFLTLTAILVLVGCWILRLLWNVAFG
ncbi:hypothetical protein [Lacticaseibacillus paracasei]|uniref:hypothetical protein n=1 Tax=Lacticaseibacillus paracasei TaxID=1597 RepID=UPI0040457B31